MAVGAEATAMELPAIVVELAVVAVVELVL